MKSFEDLKKKEEERSQKERNLKLVEHNKQRIETLKEKIINLSEEKSKLTKEVDSLYEELYDPFLKNNKKLIEEEINKKERKISILTTEILETKQVIESST